MPASLRPCHQRSLGHFKRKPGCRLWATLRPTASDRPDQSRGDKGNPKEKVNEDISPVHVSWALSHERPRRPRPAVCCSASSKTGSNRPARARRINSELVESICGNTSTLKPGRCPTTASQITSVGQTPAPK